MIAVVSVGLSLIGLELGARLGIRVEQRSELVGGIADPRWRRGRDRTDLARYPFPPDNGEPAAITIRTPGAQRREAL
jgi:hypothetical protein